MSLLLCSPPVCALLCPGKKIQQDVAGTYLLAAAASFFVASLNLALLFMFGISLTKRQKSR